MGKRIEKLNRFAAERATAAVNTPAKAEEAVKKAPAKKTVAKKDVKPPVKKDTPAKTSPKAPAQPKVPIKEPVVEKAITNRPKESIAEQLEKMSLENSFKKATSNVCLSLDTNVVDGIKKAKDMYNIPLSRLVNTVLKDFLDKNDIEY